MSAWLLVLIGFLILLPQNNDEINAEFKVYSAEGSNLNITTFVVYNRWGKVVYDANGSNNPSWDGSFNNTDAPSDTYTYFIEMDIPQCGTPIQEKGDVVLIR